MTDPNETDGMTLVEKFLAKHGGEQKSVAVAIATYGGLPEHWPVGPTFDLLSRMALEIARAEVERRSGGGFCRGHPNEHTFLYPGPDGKPWCSGCNRPVRP